MPEPTISTFSVTKGGKIEETYAAFQSWDLTLGLDENLARLREENPILAPTDAWLAEMRRIFRVRFGDIERHTPLIRLAQAGMAIETWAPILLWHLCMRELLLSDFLEEWLFPRKQEGMLRVRSDDVREYLATLGPRGLLDNSWKPSSINRMASGLPAYAADFGLLSGHNVKEIGHFYMPEEAFLYVLHDLAAETHSGARVIADPRWRRFLMTEGDVEREILHQHQRHQLRYETAGTLVTLELPHGSVQEYVDGLV